MEKLAGFAAVFGLACHIREGGEGLGDGAGLLVGDDVDAGKPAGA